MTCSCCQARYTEANDLAVCGTLVMASGGGWKICGLCIQAMWAERAPQSDPIAPLMA